MAKGRTSKKRPASKKATPKKRPASKKATPKRRPASKKATPKKRPASKKATPKRRPASKKATAKKRPASKKATAKKNITRRRTPLGGHATKLIAKRMAKGAARGRRSVRKAVKKARKRATVVAVRTARKAAKKGMAVVTNVAVQGVKAASKAMPVVSSRGSCKVRDPKDRAYERGPGFHEQTWYRPSNVEENGLQFVGHEIGDDDQNFNQFLHYDQLYTIRHGQNSGFFRNLLKGKIMGTRCPKCKDAWVPPRINCWNLDCNLQETDWVEFPLRAKVHTWTIAGWSGRSSLKRLPIVLVYAIIEGSTVAIANELHDIDPWDVEFDMPLEIVFIPEKQRTGSVTDFHFVPAKGWKPGPMTDEKMRIKKLVEPVYEWVKSMK